MRVLVIGAGAVGLAVGSCLLAAGAEVRFVAKPGGGRPLRERGLRRSGIFGEVSFDPDAFEVVETLRGATLGVDFALVCTKTTVSAELAPRLGVEDAVARGDLPVVLFHNGWGNAEEFALHMPRKCVFNARVITGFRRSEPHSVEVTVHVDAIRMGSLFGADPAALRPLAEAIDAGGIPSALSPDVSKDLWAKMLYNCALNPLSAILNEPYGALADRSVTRHLMDAVIDELFAVMAAHGFATQWETAATYRRVFYSELVPRTARHESSMLQDLQAGRRTEVDALSGAVVDLGQRAGVATPVNRALLDLVRAATATPRRSD